MNAISYAQNVLQFSIPTEILNIGFGENSPIINNNISIPERILTSVIRPRVLVDCNLVGGITTKIDTNKCNLTVLSAMEWVIKVPIHLTNGKSIISAQSLVSPVSQNSNHHIGGPNHLGYTNSELLQAGSKLMGNLSMRHVYQTARLEVIGENTIIVYEPSDPIHGAILHCTVENHANLENISPRSYPAFSELCVHAVKSYLYNKLRVKLGQGYIYSGHQLDVVKEIVDSYGDSELAYTEYLRDVWQKVAFMNNTQAFDNLITSMIGNNL